MAKSKDELAYDKASEAWLLLNKVEQLLINDKDYHPSVMQMLANTMTLVEQVQYKYECILFDQ